jgi:hypothetical protein
MAFLGTSDPDGWVICDGVQRTNITDGRYNNLIAASIGTGTMNGNYTPPNYKAAFLRGTGTSVLYTGPGVNASQNHATQTHNHTATQAAHNHAFNTIRRHGGTTGFENAFRPYYLESTTVDEVNPSNYVMGMSLRDASAAITVADSTTNVDTNETRPYNFGVNWIIKL